MAKTKIEIKDSHIEKSPIDTKGDIEYNETNNVNPSEKKSKTWFERYALPIILALIAAGAIIIGAFIGNNKNDEKIVPSQIEVSFATSKNMWCGLGLIAHDKGFFKDEGLNVKVKYLDAGRYCLDALVSNSVEFATIVEVNLAYFAYTGNKSVIDIASIVSSTSSGIIARKSSGIEKPEDLKGKKLAFSPGTTSDIFANRFIEKHGISQDDVNLMKIQPLAITGAVTSGSVDAASTWDPHIYNISKILGEDAIVFRDPEAYTGYLTVAVRKDWANKNKETVILFLKALRKAETFATENKKEAQEIISRIINLDIAIVESTWDAHQMQLKLDKDALLKTINIEGNWINQTMDNYKDKTVPDYSIYLDDSFLRELNKD